MIVKIKVYFLLGLCLILLLLLFLKSCELQKIKKLSEKIRIPDTVYVSRPYKVIEIKKEYIEKPMTVYVYPKDTSLRKRAEQNDIITGLDFKRGNIFHKVDFIRLDKINPQGIVMSMEYQMPALKEIKIDLNGNVQVKKKRFSGFKAISGAFVLGTATGYFIFKGVH